MAGIIKIQDTRTGELTLCKRHDTSLKHLAVAIFTNIRGGSSSKNTSIQPNTRVSESSFIRWQVFSDHLRTIAIGQSVALDSMVVVRNRNQP